ncbi:MAG: GNAT family N-acetyltransferase, partial [Dehalococcoidia bacterium]
MCTSDQQLLEIQTGALFTHDPTGRIRHVNEPGGDPAPRFFFGRTTVGYLWRLRHDVPANTAAKLEQLAAAEPVHDDLRAEPRHLDAMRSALRRDREIEWLESGPAYRFPDQLPATTTPTTRITRADVRLLRRFASDLSEIAKHFDAREPRVAVVDGDAAVSVCFGARLTEHAAEAGVETLEAYRGRGYAVAAVARWAEAVRATGRIPLYSTSWDNHASRAVARSLGLIQ